MCIYTYTCVYVHVYVYTRTYVCVCGIKDGTDRLVNFPWSMSDQTYPSTGSPLYVYVSG